MHGALEVRIEAKSSREGRMAPQASSQSPTRREFIATAGTVAALGASAGLPSLGATTTSAAPSADGRP